MINTILIVDDSPVARRMLKTCIPKDKGYEIFEAGNGQEGFDKYKELNPDIVFMDLTMPIMDGYQATAKIKEFDKEAIVIVTTADIQPKSIASVMELGAFTLLKKPAKASSIQEAISKVELKLDQLQEKK
jgi:two-component system chemotaxis response regulator CheY